MVRAFDPGSEVPAAELVTTARAVAALTLRCAQIEYTSSNGYVRQRDVYWVPMAVRPCDDLSWLLWEHVPPVYPDTSELLPVRGLAAVSVAVDEQVYRAQRFNYLRAPNVEKLPSGGWTAS
ncbi:hypothetical protein [Pseudoclavibacter sp. AY1H1]|uniref:hypothetical protein n=1 Tax=Pseudoclavibacter sp. AY1H1 TaxID=2080584 RepID=UPI000CE821BA|nr:hypothetical protein [Pseudoclavibacter sp. AY1H1]PPF38518.1 hypothetical protein C5E05_05795 [Pseudoclavibacter sp. AY1H1]